jgi:hypothetical protein
LKKRSKKLLILGGMVVGSGFGGLLPAALLQAQLGAPTAPGAAPQPTKVFWFFSSEKNFFLKTLSFQQRSGHQTESFAPDKN